MAKKQQIILLHGTNALTENTPNLVQGEVAVYNAATAKDVEFYATDVNGNLATFQTKAATQAAIDAAKGNVELEIAALEGQLSAETSARETADNALAGRLDVIEGEGEGSIKKAVADEKARAEGKEGELAQSIADEATARAEADEAMDTRVANIEALVGGGEGEGEGTLATRVTTLEGKVETLNGDAETEGSVANKIATAEAVVRKDFADADAVVKQHADDAVAAEKELREAADAQIRTDFGAADADVLADAKEYTDGKIADVTSGYTAADAQVLADAKEYTDGKIADVTSGYTAAVEEVQEQVDILNGTGEGSVDKKVADAIAEVVASAPEDLDTLKEIADFIANDQEGAASLVNRIAALEAIDHDAYKDADDAVREEFAAADKTLADRLDVVQGEASVEGSIKKAVADEKARAEGKEGELAQSIADEATARAEAITAVTAAYELADEALGGRIDTIVNAKPVYEIDVVGEYGDKVVVTKTENKYELNFDAFVIDGGTY